MFRLSSYVAVGREVVLDDQAVARAERQAVDVHGAVRARSDSPRARDRAALSPTAQDADVARRGEVLIEVRRRDAQHVGDVVEAVARHVGGQHRRASISTPSRSSTAVAYSVRFSRCSGHAAGLGSACRGGRVEIALERRDELVDLGRVRARLAGRRHQVAAQLANDLLPRPPASPRHRRPHVLERQLTGELRVVVAVRAVAVEDSPTCSRPPARASGSRSPREQRADSARGRGSATTRVAVRYSESVSLPPTTSRHTCS